MRCNRVMLGSVDCVTSTAAILSSEEDLFEAKNLPIEVDVLYALPAFCVF